MRCGPLPNLSKVPAPAQHKIVESGLPSLPSVVLKAAAAAEYPSLSPSYPKHCRAKSASSTSVYRMVYGRRDRANPTCVASGIAPNRERLPLCRETLLDALLGAPIQPKTLLLCVGLLLCGVASLAAQLEVAVLRSSVVTMILRTKSRSFPPSYRTAVSASSRIPFCSSAMISSPRACATQLGYDLEFLVLKHLPMTKRCPASDDLILQRNASLICTKTSANLEGLSDKLIRGLTGQSDP